MQAIILRKIGKLRKIEIIACTLSQTGDVRAIISVSININFVKVKADDCVSWWTFKFMYVLNLTLKKIEVRLLCI